MQRFMRTLLQNTARAITVAARAVIYTIKEELNMSIQKQARVLALSAAMGMLSLPAAQAEDFSFSGNFNRDDDVQLFTFEVGSTSNVILRSWSYAGGVNAAGQNIARGGFDPILALFDSSGAKINENDDGDSNVPTDLSGSNFDVFLTSTLASGTYTVSVMQYDNFSAGDNLSAGFERAGQGNFTAVPEFSGCGAPMFNDVSGGDFCARDSHWAFDILNVQGATQVTPIPEPTVAAMMLAGLAGIAWRKKRHSSAP